MGKTLTTLVMGLDMSLHSQLIQWAICRLLRTRICGGVVKERQYQSYWAMTQDCGMLAVMVTALHGITGLHGFGFLQITAQIGHMVMDLTPLLVTC